MSVLFMDGFDHYGNRRHPGAVKKWDLEPTLTDIFVSATAPVRNGTHSLKMAPGSILRTHRFEPGASGVLAGFAVYFPAMPTTGINLLQILEDNVNVSNLRHLSLRVDPTSRLFQVRGEDDIVMAYGTTVVNINTWYYLEFRAFLNRGSGEIRFRVNGKTELWITSVDSGHSDGTINEETRDCIWNRIRLSGIVPGDNTIIDDFYLSNLNGPAPYNNFLGMCRIETILPSLGNGNINEFEVFPTGEIDHGKQVDEPSPNSHDYNIAPKHLISDTKLYLDENYNYPPIKPLQIVTVPYPPSEPLLERIVGVQPNLYVQRDQTNNFHVKSIMVVPGGGSYLGPDNEVEEFWKYITQMFESNPNGSIEWTQETVNSILVGLRAFPPPVVVEPE